MERHVASLSLAGQRRARRAHRVRAEHGQLLEHHAQVAILLALYQGAAHLEPQLGSFLAQDHTAWRLLTSDDGSTDGTHDAVTAFGARAGRPVSLFAGPRRGYAANFLSLFDRGLSGAEWVALSDQDDVWLPDHLSRAVAALGPEAGPALYCCRSWVTTAPMYACALLVCAESTVWLRPKTR